MAVPDTPEPENRMHILSLVVENDAGVLARVVGLFAGRGYNIESLNVAEVDEASHLSRITIMTCGTPQVIKQIKAQLARLVPTLRVVDLTWSGPHVVREMGLVKVHAGGERRIESLRIADIFRARVVDATHESFVFELTGDPDKIEAFISLMQPLGLCEVVRTGRVAISRGPGALQAMQDSGLAEPDRSTA